MAAHWSWPISRCRWPREHEGGGFRQITISKPDIPTDGKIDKQAQEGTFKKLGAKSKGENMYVEGEEATGIVKILPSTVTTVIFFSLNYNNN